METVDSKEQLLAFPVVVTNSVQRLIDEGEIDLPLQVVLIALAKEATLETCNVYQSGNTVFIGHISPDKRRMLGRAFNMDTPNNFLDNGLQYFRYINKIGVRDYYTHFKNPSYASAFKYMDRALSKSTVKDRIDIEIYPSRNNPELTIVHVNMDGKFEE